MSSFYGNGGVGKNYDDTIQALKENFSDVYDSEKSYNKGDFVIYENNLYKCITTISTPEEWNPSHWEKANIIDTIDAVEIGSVIDAENGGVKMGNITDNTASGQYAIAEGSGTTAFGDYSHAEGNETSAMASSAHAEGDNTIAGGAAAHAEGGYTVASGENSHAQGDSTRATGAGSHAEGGGSEASGFYSHAEGTGTIANHKSQHVFGEYNVEDPSTAEGTSRGTYVEIVGNGTGAEDSKRSNARTLDWDGNEKLAGSITLGAGTENETELTATKLKELIESSGGDQQKYDEAIQAIDENFSDIYDSESIYAEGDFVVYENTLYKATTEISTPEEWNPLHWEKTNVKEIIENIETGNIIDITYEESEILNITKKQ